MKNLLSERPAKFRFSHGDQVRAPLYFGAKNKLAGTIAEGIWHDGHVFYEMEPEAKRGSRFAAREEDVESNNETEL